MPVVTQVEHLTDPAALAAIADEWDALAGALPDPFMTTAWLLPWWEAFAPAGGGVFVARREGRVCGGLTAMANDHTPVLRPFAADEDAQDALVAAAIDAHGGTLRLPALPADHPLATGPRTVAVPRAVSPIVETTGAFEDWRALSKPRWGAPLERFRRKMDRERGLRVYADEVPADLEAELERGFAVEASGWKGREGTAIVSRPETERFYRAMAATFHARGELVCSGLELDGRLAAWDLSLLHADRVFLVKTGFHEDFRKLAPGLVLRLCVVEDCFGRGFVAHELLGHVDDWKPKFATTERRHVEATISAGAAGHARASLREAAARVVRRARG